MKNTSIILLIISGFIASCSTDDRAQLEHAQALYLASVQSQDEVTQRVLLNELILLDSSNLAYKDSLSRIFIKDGNYVGGLALAEEVIEAGVAENKLLELTGVAYQQVRKLNKATTIFKTLFSSTKDYRYAYQVAAISYEQDDFNEFDSLTNQLLSLTLSDTLAARTLIDFPGPLTGSAQLIPMDAATLFLKGKYAFDKKQDLRVAVSYYQQAIGKFESFEMPYYYLQEIERMQLGSR
jgi:tetratricopeptide (TPR) repeat protein